MLFVSEAEDKATQPVFLLKLLLITVGVVVTARIRRVLFGSGSTPTAVAAGARALAISSLAVWGGPIVTGRLMAYLK